MNHDNKYDLIDKFNAGELNGKELEEFIGRMNDDPEFARYVKFSKKIDSFFQVNIARIEMREQLEEIYNETILGKKKNKFYRISRIKLFNSPLLNKIAACIFCLFAIGTILCLFLRPPKNERLYSQYFKPYSGSDITRGDNKIKEDKFSIAMNAYNNKDYNTSFKLFEELSSAEPENMSFLFYKAILAMENKKYDEAISSFKTIINNKSSLYIDSSEWYLALSYLGKNDILNSKKVLNQITKCDTYYRNQAESLLQELQ